jgi:hypothetical protein
MHATAHFIMLSICKVGIFYVYSFILRSTVRENFLEHVDREIEGRDCLRAERSKSWISSPGSFKNFHYAMSSRYVLGPTQSSIQWVPGVCSDGMKRQGREADH